MNAPIQLDSRKTNSLLPRLEMRVGITGHRPPRLRAENLERIRQDLRGLFTAMAETLVQIHADNKTCFSPQRPRIVLVSPLAAGSDSLAAEVALEVGGGFAACLPFDADTYRQDFAGEDMERFDRLLSAAQRTLVLPGEDYSRDEAYRAVGLLTAAQCDILLAVWDGEQAHGIGGTPEIIADAVAKSLPVLVIDAQAEKPPRLLWNLADDVPHDTPTIDTVAEYDAHEKLARVVEELAAPPATGSGFLNDLALADLDTWPRPIGYPLLLVATGARTWKQAFNRANLADSAAQLSPLLTCFGTKPEGSEAGTAAGKLLDRFAAADVAATHYALRYRGGYITNYAMSALAVGLALTGLLLPKLKMVFVVAELLTIILIVLRTRSANRSAWHRRWIDARHLAELLRLLPLAAALGDLSLLRNSEDEVKGCHGWYARTTARELGICAGKIDKERVTLVKEQAVALIEDQIRYHKINAQRMRKMDHRLRHAGEGLFIVTIIGCIVWLVAKGLHLEHAIILGMNLTSLVVFLAALLPAIGAALYGIRTQGDFCGFAERSRLIANRLGKLRLAMLRDPLDYRRLTARLRRLSEIMLAEVDQWRQLSESRPLELPG
jgi:hypothetical protein